MKLYLIRHGQTEWNIAGKIQGKTDIPLNEEGLKQAELLSAAMKEKQVSAIFTSPLKRAFKTAELLAAEKGLPAVPLEELKEVDFGLWEGLTWEQINAAYPEDFRRWDKNPAANTPTGGESREDCRARCQKAVEQILKQADGDAAVVAHGGILVFVADYLCRFHQEKNEIIVKNASITTVEYDKKTGMGSVVSLNDTGHLRGLTENTINKYC